MSRFDPDGRDDVGIGFEEDFANVSREFDDPVADALREGFIFGAALLSPLPGDEAGLALALGPRLVKPLVTGARAVRAAIKFKRLIKSFSAVKTRVTRAGTRGVRITRKDGSVIDITEARVREFVPEPRAKKGLRPVKFDDALPGTKGKKRAPTKEELELLERLAE